MVDCQMDIQTGEWMDGYMDGCYKRIDGWVEGEIYEWISGLTDYIWMSKQINGWMAI